MAAYHVVLVHFPIAIWMTATLAILVRALSNGTLAQAIERALVPLLSIGLLMGIAAYTVGLMVWPWEALSATPLGRNHMLMASWTTAYWALILAILWMQGERVWQGAGRWVMAGLAILGSALLGITGTLGGNLIGVHTEVTQLLRLMGWEVYTTFYVPNLTLVVLVLASFLLFAIGVWGRRILPVR